MCWLFKRKKKVVTRIDYINVNNIFEWSIIEVEILNKWNKYRISKGLEPLIPCEDIWIEGGERTKYFDGVDKVTHDEVGESFKDLKALGLKAPTEILNGVTKSHTANQIIERFINSSDHNIILLSPLRNLVGISYLTDEDQAFVCCMTAKG